MSDDEKNPSELLDLYRELILDHAHSPRHFGRISHPTHYAEGINPLCGDKLKMYFQVDSESNIVDAKFEGSGCAISVASASLLTDAVIGKNTQFANNFFSAVISLLSGDPGPGDANQASVDLGKIKALEGVKEFPSRVKCATLAWHALNSALQNNNHPATTE